MAPIPHRGAGKAVAAREQSRPDTVKHGIDCHWHFWRWLAPFVLLLGLA
jgi:hypothetical protein